MIQLFKKNKKEPGNLKEILASLKALEGNIQGLTQELKEFKGNSKKNFQKIGLVRFNPFQEIGGDQSFSIALLDANNNGFVISSHYGREANRVYAKPIEKGTSQYQLSKEEIAAITRAIGSGNPKS